MFKTRGKAWMKLPQTIHFKPRKRVLTSLVLLGEYFSRYIENKGIGQRCRIKKEIRLLYLINKLIN